MFNFLGGSDSRGFSGPIHIFHVRYRLLKFLEIRMCTKNPSSWIYHIYFSCSSYHFHLEYSLLRNWHLAQGTDDSLVPLAFSQHAKRVLPQVQLHILEGHGHFSWFCYCGSCHRELYKTLFGEVPGLDELDEAPEPELASPTAVESPTTPSEVAPREEPDVAPTTTAPEAPSAS